MRSRDRLTILAVAVCGLPSHAQQQLHPELQASYQLLSTDLTAGEPVFVGFKLENNTSERVTLDLGLNGYGDFRLRIVRPDGQVRSAPNPTWTMGTSGKVSLEPFASYNGLLLISRWFDFNAAGIYELDITPPGPATTASGAELPRLAQGHLLIDVGPRNPKRLEEICAALEKKILDATTAASAMELAEVLNHIVDPIAVPHLARLLDAKKMMEVDAVKGLARIADSTAVDVLIAHLNNPSQEIRDYIRSRLAGIERTSNDSEIRRKISTAFAQIRQRGD